MACDQSLCRTEFILFRPTSRRMTLTTPATSSRSSSRCCVCRDLQYEDSHPSNHGSAIVFNTSYHETIADVRRSADQGCHFCRLILGGLSFDSKQQRETTLADDTPFKLELYMERSWNKVQKTHVKQNGAVFWLRMGGVAAAKHAPIHVRYRVQLTEPSATEPSPPPSLPTDPPLLPDHQADPHTGSPRTRRQNPRCPQPLSAASLTPQQ